MVSGEEWLEARKALLKKEKEFTRQKDQLFAECQALPWVKVEKNYVDHLPKGRNETGPGYNLGDWVRHHDRYEANQR